MSTVLDNISVWMLLNVFLAFLGMFFGFTLKTKNLLLRIPLFILWLLFIPNTIYLLTDLQYFPGQVVKLGFSGQVVLVLQYFLVIFLGVLTFVLGLYPFEKILYRFKNRMFTNIVLFSFNYLIAFAVALGKIQRINSWDVFFNPFRVVTESLSLLSIPGVWIFIILFGSLGNIIYFSLRKSARLKKIPLI